MPEYTIIGEYYPENGKIVRMGNEGIEVVADAFVAYFILNGSFKGYKSVNEEKKHFEDSLSDTDFVNYLGMKKVKKIRVAFMRFFIWYKIKQFFKL